MRRSAPSSIGDTGVAAASGSAAASSVVRRRLASLRFLSTPSRCSCASRSMLRICLSVLLRFVEPLVRSTNAAALNGRGALNTDSSSDVGAASLVAIAEKDADRMAQGSRWGQQR